MDAAACLLGINVTLRAELLAAYGEIVRNYREHRWEPSELNGGKLCEIVYSVLHGYVEGKMPSRATKPKNMFTACVSLENADAAVFPRSVRIQIPRLLIGLYEIRNSRGVGHVGGDVDPNNMDARLVLESSKWIMAELVRVFHSISTVEASEVVDSLIDRTVPMVWETTAAKKRVLQRGLSMRDQTLLLLYSSSAPIEEITLFAWVEHSNASVYRRDILRKAHKERLLEYDERSTVVELSPYGVAYVEDELL